MQNTKVIKHLDELKMIIDTTVSEVDYIRADNDFVVYHLQTEFRKFPLGKNSFPEEPERKLQGLKRKRLRTGAYGAKPGK